MTDQPNMPEPEDLLPPAADFEPGAEQRAFNPEQLEGMEPEDPFANPQEFMEPTEGFARSRNKQYPNLPPVSGALPQ
jgi:hypothetical protein